MGFVGIFWKNNVPEAYLPKMSISGQIVSEIVAQLCLKNSTETLLNFFWVDPKKIRRVCMEFSKYNWATISETICPEMLIFGKYASWTLFFQNILTNPITPEILFLWRHTLVLYFFLFTVCSIHALGMESNSLPNSSITASSVWTQHPGHDPWLARLNNVPKHGSTGSWSAKFNKTGEWLQVDLGEDRLLTNHSTQGRPSMNQWVTSYNISFSSDSVKWEPYKENNVVKVCDRDFIS